MGGGGLYIVAEVGRKVILEEFSIRMAEKRNWHWITDLDEFDKFIENLAAEDWAEIERQIEEGTDIYI